MLKLQKSLSLFLTLGLFLLLSGCGQQTPHTLNSVIHKVIGPSQGEKNRQLIAKLRSADADQRRIGVLELAKGKAAAWKSTPEVLAAMATDDQSVVVRATALRSLAKVDNENQFLEDTLKKSVYDDDPVVRMEAVRILQVQHDSEAQKLLLDVLNNDKDISVRSEAARMLVAFANPLVVHSLIETLSEQEFALLYRARRSLVDITGQDFKYDQDAWRKWANDNDNLVSQKQPEKSKWYHFW